MQSRKRNRLITILSRTPGEDDAGQPLNTWTVKVAQAWADIRYQRGLEVVRAGAEQARAQVSINIGYRTGLNTDMRVRQGAVEFQIKAVLPDEAGRTGVDLVCEVIQ